MTAISQGGTAKRVKVLTAADLKANGGSYALEGRPPLAVYGVSEAETKAQGGQFAVEGNIAQPVYIVDTPDGAVTGNVPVPMIAVDGTIATGNVAIPVYVIAGSLNPIDPRWNGDSVLYFTLDEASGDRPALVGGVTAIDNNTVGSAAGVIDLAARFVAANNEYLSAATANPMEIGGGDFTIRFWAKRISGGGSFQIALGKDDFPSSPREWAIFARFGDINEFRLILFDASDNVVGDIATASISLDTWYHVVFTRSGTDLAAYLDAGTPVTASTTGTPRSSSAAVFTISAPSGAGNLNGDIDEVAIVKGIAWDAAQVTYDYNGGAGQRYPN